MKHHKILIMLFALLLTVGCKKSEETSSAADEQAVEAHDAHEGHDNHGEHADHGDHDGHDHHEHETLPAGDFSKGSLYQLETEMTNQKGEALTWDDFKGEPVLVTMIYTKCTTACPMIIADVKTLRKEAGSDARVLIVTMDPERDQVEELAQLFDRNDLDDNWTIARTSEEDVRTLASAIGFRYRQLPSGDFNHSQLVALLNGDGEIVVHAEGVGQKRKEMIDALNGN